MKKYLPFLAFWVVNSLLLWLASTFYPTYYVLGNANLTSLLAAVVAGLVWTAVVWKSMVFTKKLKIKDSDMLKMTLYFLAVNFVTLWLVARFSGLFGFGVVSYIWVFALAFVANLAQWGAWALTSKK